MMYVLNLQTLIIFSHQTSFFQIKYIFSSKVNIYWGHSVKILLLIYTISTYLVSVVLFNVHIQHEDRDQLIP